MAVGLAAIDNCVGIGSCPLNCGSRACDVNNWEAAYPNYPDCGISCEKIPTMPRLSGCDATVWFESPCRPGVHFGARLWECGPDDGQFNTAGACNDGTNLKIVACITTSLFSELCNGCDPWLWGIIRVNVPSL